MFRSQSVISLIAATTLAALLAGCGGGGGGGGSNGGGSGVSQTYYGSISGKIVDPAGNPVPGAIVFLDGQSLNTNVTYQQGGYEITNVTPGFHIVSVSSTVSGVTYTGATDIAIPNVAQNAITNGNVIASPANTQAAVSGYVYYSDGVTPVPGARVVFQTNFAAANALASSTPAGTAGIVAITDSTGHYQLGGEDLGTSTIVEAGLPTTQIDSSGTSSPRSYTITASVLPVNGTSYANAPTITKQFTTDASVAPANSQNFTLPIAPTLSASGTTPTVNFLLAFTQPDIQPFYPPQSEPASASAAYAQIRAKLAPKYAQLASGEHASALVKHLTAHTVKAHATASNYTIEMDLFFSLPGDSGSTLSPVRSELSGFDILNNAISTDAGDTPTISGYDYLQDPLANYYVDPDLGAGGFVYNEDTSYSFEVQSVATNGSTVFTASPAVAVSPLSFVNVSQPADPNDNNSAITTLTADPTFLWTTVDSAQTSISNNRVGSYYVSIYNAFPGATTTPVYQSGALTPSALVNSSGQEAFTPSGLSLTTGEYWVIVSATASDDTATAAAISVSQIIPFNVP